MSDPPDMTGRVCVVTGATSGIGKAAAKALAWFGATVVVVGRDESRSETAASEIRSAGGGDGGEDRVRIELADLSVQAEVRDLAARLHRLNRLDVLINNAGLTLGPRTLTADGIETTLAVNHLAPFLLTNLRMDLLRASEPSRVVTVASTAHRAGRIDFDDLQLERGYFAQRAYNNSKLANVLFTRELARRLDGTGVTANCAHPGTVRTRWGDSAGFLMRIGVRIGRPFMLSAEQGADTIVWLASSPEVEGQSAGYYVKRQLRRPSSAAMDDEAAARLWEESARLTGLD